MKRTKKFLPFLLVGLILIAGNTVAYRRPEFWAEDGSDFFAQAFRLGWRCLFVELGGYQNLLSRFIAALGTLLPVRSAPSWYVWTAWIICVACLGYFSGEGFAWLVPRRCVRVTLCVLFTIAPGSFEVTQAICNIHTVLTLGFALLLLEKTIRWSIGRFLVLTLIAFSTPELPILIPLILLLGYQRRQRRYFFSVCVIAAAFVFNTFGISHLQGGYALTMGHFWAIPKILIERLFLYTFVLPALGPRFGEIFFHTDRAAYWPVLFGAFTVFFFLFRRRCHEWNADERATYYEVLPVAAALCLAGAVTFAMLALTRPYLWSQVVRPQGNTFWTSRYAFLPVVFSLLAWTSLLSQKDWKKCRTWGKAGWLFLALFCLYLLRFPTKAWPRPNVDWPRSAAAIGTLLEQKKQGQLLKTVEVTGIKMQPDAYAAFSILVEPARE